MNPELTDTLTAFGIAVVSASAHRRRLMLLCVLTFVVML